jgi:hypothetical protein
MKEVPNESGSKGTLEPDARRISNRYGETWTRGNDFVEVCGDLGLGKDANIYFQTGKSQYRRLNQLSAK